MPLGEGGANRPVRLQEYFIDLLESQGALVETPAYGLAEVLLPPELARYLEVPEHLWLAFDCEVAQETPGAEFVSWGSPLLERAVKLGLSLGRVSRKYAVVERLAPPPNLLEKVERRLTFVRCHRPRVGPVALVQAEALLFEFLVRFISDEKQEKLYSVLVDGVTGKEINEQKEALERVFFAPAAPEIEDLPAAPRCTYHEAYERAKAALADGLGADLDAFRERMGRFLAEEERRLAAYYRSTITEIEKRAQRLEAADPRRERLAQKLAATRADAAKRLEDVRQKYQVRLEAELDGLRVYVLPKVAFTLELEHKSNTVSLPLYYNLATNELELPVCAVCGRFYDTVYIRQGSTPGCAACAG